MLSLKIKLTIYVDCRKKSFVSIHMKTLDKTNTNIVNFQHSYKLRRNDSLMVRDIKHKTEVKSSNIKNFSHLNIFD